MRVNALWPSKAADASEVSPAGEDLGMDPGVAAETLAAREAEIQAQLALIETASKRATAGGIGFGKRVGDGTNIAVERMTDFAAHTGPQRELLQIGSAKAALAAGAYGACELCGSDIGTSRLEARPASTRCVRCAT